MHVRSRSRWNTPQSAYPLERMGGSTDVSGYRLMTGRAIGPLCLWALVVGLGLTAPCLDSAAQGVSVGGAAPAYRSLFPDAPPSRIGSATRGSYAVTGMVVLAPNTKGATASSQPTLFWYLPTPSDLPVEVVVQEIGADLPLLEVNVAPDHEARVGSLDLGTYGVELRPDANYEWSVALVVDSDRRSQDVFSMGAIVYVPMDPAVVQRIRAEPVSKQVELLLAEGYWYEALELLEKNAADPRLAGWRDRLLRSEGLLAGDVGDNS